MQVSQNILSVTAPAIAAATVKAAKTTNPTLKLAQLKTAMDKTGDAMIAAFDEYLAKEVIRIEAEIVVYEYLLEKFAGMRKVCKEINALLSDDVEYLGDLKTENPPVYIFADFGDQPEYKAVNDAFNRAANAYETFEAKTQTKGAKA